MDPVEDLIALGEIVGYVTVIASGPGEDGEVLMCGWPFAVPSLGVACCRPPSDDSGPGARLARCVATQQPEIQLTDRVLYGILGIGKRYAEVHDVRRSESPDVVYGRQGFVGKVLGPGGRAGLQLGRQVIKGIHCAGSVSQPSAVVPGAAGFPAASTRPA